MVRVPTYIVYLWLPRAHVGAPVSALVNPAEVLSKHCGYELLCVLPVLFKFGFVFGAIWVFGFGWWSVVSLFCIRQNDLGSLITSFSASHKGMLISP